MTATALWILTATGAAGVGAWWDRARARPGYERAIAAHDHPTVVRGTERIRDAKAADPTLRGLPETPA